jgi:hypothetical protein
MRIALTFTVRRAHARMLTHPDVCKKDALEMSLRRDGCTRMGSYSWKWTCQGGYTVHGFTDKYVYRATCKRRACVHCMCPGEESHHDSADYCTHTNRIIATVLAACAMLMHRHMWNTPSSTDYSWFLKVCDTQRFIPTRLQLCICDKRRVNMNVYTEGTPRRNFAINRPK